ncbi:MAG: ABC transporter permease [Acidimicrobiales bacterium]
MSVRQSPLWLVAAREVTEALRRKSLWITCAVLAALSTAVMILPDVLSSDDPTSYEVALLDTRPALEAALVDSVGALDAELEVLAVDSEDAARLAVEDDDADVAVIGGDPATIIVTTGENDVLVGAVRQALASTDAVERLQGAGLDDDEISGVLQAPAPQLELLDAGGDARRGAAFALSLVMYLILVLVMAQVANGVAVEKANRISEVLLPIVSPASLLFGKVLGVGLIGVFTVLVGATPVLVKLGLGGDLPDGLGGALAGGGAWLLLGLALYLVLAGALGALVERAEEAGSAVAPLNIILIGAYLVGGSAPETPVSQVLAYIPLTSPMVMPSRIAVGAASPVEMAISLALGVLAVALAVRFASIVYRRAIVRTGGRLKVRELLRTA